MDNLLGNDECSSEASPTNQSDNKAWENDKSGGTIDRINNEI